LPSLDRAGREHIDQSDQVHCLSQDISHFHFTLESWPRGLQTDHEIVVGVPSPGEMDEALKPRLALRDDIALRLASGTNT
jgi:hypothetical protein